MGIGVIHQVSYLNVVHLNVLCNQMCAQEIRCFEGVVTNVAVEVLVSGRVITSVTSHLRTFASPHLRISNYQHGLVMYLEVVLPSQESVMYVPVLRTY